MMVGQYLSSNPWAWLISVGIVVLLLVPALIWDRLRLARIRRRHLGADVWPVTLPSSGRYKISRFLVIDEESVALLDGRGSGDCWPITEVIHAAETRVQSVSAFGSHPGLRLEVGPRGKRRECSMVFPSCGGLWVSRSVPRAVHQTIAARKSHADRRTSHPDS